MKKNTKAMWVRTNIRAGENSLGYSKGECKKKCKINAPKDVCQEACYPPK